MALRSFRARLLLGSMLWTAGLLFLAHTASLLLFRRGVSLRMFHVMPAGVAIALFALGAGVAQVRTGISPLRGLRARLSAVRDGRTRRIEGTYPSEVQPLVDDLNALLDHREEVVRRALTKAGDLAHGLKTPLAVLAQEAASADARGETGRAAVLREQVERMRRQIEYHLAHARAAGSGAAPGARCSVAASAEGLARTLARLHAERGVTIDVAVSPDHSFRGEIEDLDEMLGNLLDNACKWARRRVRLESKQAGGRLAVTIDDDGPGLERALWDQVLRRGVRADETAPGSGLGLAIVRDLAELYGGTISLGESPERGLRATLDLPA